MNNNNELNNNALEPQTIDNNFNQQNANSMMQEQMPTPASLDVVAPVEVPGGNPVPQMLFPNVEMPGVPAQQPNKKKGSKAPLFIVLGLLLVAVIGVAVYFLVFAKDKKEPEKENKEPDKQEEQKEPEKEKNERPDWDPKTSIIKEADSDTKLICTSETAPYSGMMNRITYTYLYKDGVSVQLIIEDEMLFSDDTMKYYEYYVGSGLEEVDYQKSEYDNITIEVREKKESVSLAYAFDYTADSSNPKNMLIDKDLDQVRLTTKMQNQGFSCE